jgi:hypothetical protein
VEEAEGEIGADSGEGGVGEERAAGAEVEDRGGGGNKEALLVRDGGEVEAEEAWRKIEHPAIVDWNGVRSIEVVNACEWCGQEPMIARRGVG